MSIERLLKSIVLAGVRPGGNSWDAITNQQLKRALSSLWWISICPGIMYQLTLSRIVACFHLFNSP